MGKFSAKRWPTTDVIRNENPGVQLIQLNTILPHCLTSTCVLQFPIIPVLEPHCFVYVPGVYSGVRLVFYMVGTRVKF